MQINPRNFYVDRYAPMNPCMLRGVMCNEKMHKLLKNLVLQWVGELVIGIPKTTQSDVLEPQGHPWSLGLFFIYIYF